MEVGSGARNVGHRKSSGWQSGRTDERTNVDALHRDLGAGKRWRLVRPFPDLPGCATHGPSVHEAITTASGVASAWLAATRESGDQTPAPRPYEDIRADAAWAADRGIDWSTAVSLVQVDAAP